MATKDITDVQVCLAYAKANHKDGFADTLLERQTGQHPKVVFRAMERACDRGLIDYGVSLRAGWLTEKGMALIAAFVRDNVQMVLCGLANRRADTD